MWSVSLASENRMKITEQLLRTRIGKGNPLQTAELVNLSNSNIVSVDNVGLCPKLWILLLSNNKIERVTQGLQQCPQLWHVDLSYNKIYNVDGFSRFIAMGELNLANNNLNWQELSKLRHLHILHLYLHGNPQLEQDPYYRIHVIDCFPNIWFLDGRLVTSAERLQVHNFFEDLALSSRPVRRKLPSETAFLPSSLRDRQINGVFGNKATQMMTQFPVLGPSNTDTDERRLTFYAKNIIDDMKLEKKYQHRDHQLLQCNDTFLEELLLSRKKELQRGNMLILLVMVSLEFSLPVALLKDTLELAKLDRIGKVCCLDLFLLPKETCCLVACTLMGSVKIERINKKIGGLYDRLYLALNYLLAELVKRRCLHRKVQLNTVYRQYRALLAAEVVQLMCIVPSFFDYIKKEPGVMALLLAATGENEIIQKVTQLANVLSADGFEERIVLEGMARLILHSVQKNLRAGRDVKTLDIGDAVLYRNPLPKRPMSGPVYTSWYHTRGWHSPDRRPTRVSSVRSHGRPKVPIIGDRILIAPQSVARMVSLPQADIALVQVETISVNGSMVSKGIPAVDQYSYVDVRQLSWDNAEAYWKPRGMTGDRLTLHHPATVSHHPSQKEVPLSQTVSSSQAEANVLPSSEATVNQANSNNLAVDSSSTPEQRPILAHSVQTSDAPPATARTEVTTRPETLSEALTTQHGNIMDEEPRSPPYLSPYSKNFLTVKIPQKEFNFEKTELNAAQNTEELIGVLPLRVDDFLNRSSGGDTLTKSRGALCNARLSVRSRAKSAPHVPSQSPRVARLETMLSKSPRPFSAVEAYSLTRKNSSRLSNDEGATVQVRQKMEPWSSHVRVGEVFQSHMEYSDKLTRIKSTQASPSESVVKSAQLWLGEGRDLHQEELRKRPRFVHVAGWKEGADHNLRRHQRLRKNGSQSSLSIGQPCYLGDDSLPITLALDRPRGAVSLANLNYQQTLGFKRRH